MDEHFVQGIVGGVLNRHKNRTLDEKRIATLSVEMAGLMFDGFQLDEAASVCVYPQFSNDGGVDSERTFVKQLVQKYINDGTTDDLFNEDEIDDEYDDDF